MSEPNKFEAPLVHLVEQDPSKMSQAELAQYIKELREMRSAPQTRKSATERKPKKTQGNVDLSQIL